MDAAIFNQLSRKAVKAALSGQWETAIQLNREILEQNPTNTETLNRLARALFEINQITKAKKIYKQVLKVDKYNPIALNNLQRLKLNPEKRLKTASLHSNQSFLEEPGKTKTAKLVRPGSNQALSEISSGSSLDIIAKKRLIALQFKTQYIGSLPEDLSFRLLKLIKRGNRYSAIVKSINKNSLTVFLRETYQDPKNANIISFPEK